MNRIAILLTPILLSACTQYTERLKKDEVIGSGDAILYGSFYIAAKETKLSGAGHATVGLQFECKDGKKYIIRFYNSDPVHAIKISPATCDLKAVVTTNSDGIEQGRIAFIAPSTKNLQFQAGNAYYLGDFVSAHQQQSNYRGDRWEEWGMPMMLPRFEQTTAQALEKFPGLGNLSRVDISRTMLPGKEIKPSSPPQRGQGGGG